MSSSADPQAVAVVRLCSTCRTEQAGDDLAALSAAIDTAGLSGTVVVRHQACMNVCAEPIAAALQGAGRATYVFAGLALPHDTADLIATVRLYLESPTGWIDDARACGRLRHCLKARVRAWDAE